MGGGGRLYLIRLAKQAKRIPLDVKNRKNQTEPTLSEADRTGIQVFLQHMRGMLPVLGVHASEQPPKAPAASAPEANRCSRMHDVGDGMSRSFRIK